MIEFCDFGDFFHIFVLFSQSIPDLLELYTTCNYVGICCLVIHYDDSHNTREYRILIFQKFEDVNVECAPNVNQKRKSITLNIGQYAYFSQNRQANDINIRIIPCISTPNLLNFQTFPATHLLNFREFSKLPN